MKQYAKIDKKAYQLAKDYLPDWKIKGVTASLVAKYLDPPANSKPTSKEGIYQRILESAQNAHMKARVIGGAIGGVGKMSRVLEGFNPEFVINKYANNWEAILDDIVKELKPRGVIRRTPRSEWPQYCHTILSGANFIEQFSSE